MKKKKVYQNVEWIKKAINTCIPIWDMKGYNLKKEVWQSLSKRQFMLNYAINDKDVDGWLYSNEPGVISIQTHLHYIIQHWSGIEAYLNNSKDWMTLGGVNNVLLMKQATVIDFNYE